MKKITICIWVLCLLNSCTKDNPSTINNPTNPNPPNYVNNNSTGFIDNNLPINNQVFSGSFSTVNLSKFDLSYKMPPIRKQGYQGSCVAFSLSYLKSFQEAKERGVYSYSSNTQTYSPAYIYNQSKSQGDCLSGAMISNALSFLINKGVSTEYDFGYDENNCTTIPSASLHKSAYRNRIKSWSSIPINSNNLYNTIKTFLIQEQPVIIGVTIDKSFQTLGSNTSNEVVWSYNNSIVLTDQGHCMLIVGFDDNKNAFKVWNSWGDDWGNEGWIWIDYDFLRTKLNEAYVTTDNIAIGTNCDDFIIPKATNIGFGYSVNSNGKINYPITPEFFDLHIGGASPYQYSLDGVNFYSTKPQVNQDGMYDLYIKDSRGCIVKVQELIK